MVFAATLLCRMHLTSRIVPSQAAHSTEHLPSVDASAYIPSGIGHVLRIPREVLIDAIVPFVQLQVLLTAPEAERYVEDLKEFPIEEVRL